MGGRERRIKKGNTAMVVECTEYVYAVEAAVEAAVVAAVGRERKRGEERERERETQ